MFIGSTPSILDEIFQGSGDKTCEELMEEVCENVQSGGVFIELTSDMNKNNLFKAVIVFGGVINAVFFLLMWRIKELQVHPMPLFALTLAVDSTFLIVAYCSLNQCDFKLHKIFALTVFYSTECEDQFRAQKLITASASWWIIFCIATEGVL